MKRDKEEDGGEEKMENREVDGSASIMHHCVPPTCTLGPLVTFNFPQLSSLIFFCQRAQIQDNETIFPPVWCGGTGVGGAHKVLVKARSHSKNPFVVLRTTGSGPDNLSVQ